MIGAGAGPRMRTEGIGRRAKCRREVVHVGGNRRFLRPARNQPHHPAIRGHAVFFSLGQLAPGEPLVVVRGRAANRGMVGRVSLHENPAGPITSPGASGHLRHELEGPLGGPEIRQMKRRVGVDHTHQASRWGSPVPWRSSECPARSGHRRP